MTESQPLKTQLRRKPQQKRSQQRVEQILKSAAEVFDDVGYEAATTHMIAARSETAIGSLYQFFPDKLAIFHSLESRYMERVMEINGALLQSADPQRPFAEFMDRMVEAHVTYFQDPMPRVVYLQYFVAPQIFILFNENFNQRLIQQFGALLQRWNPELTAEKSERLAETVNQCYNALLLQALRGEESKQQARYEELKALVVAYLTPHLEPTVEKVMKIMKCPHCHSSCLSKNGHRHNKQRYLCKDCGRQFLERDREY
ncbi:transcriptional regulator, TetR family [Pseudanabaena sp. lw0831]|uniref:TetR/AcrR family transcriptional regulator n=1 Tax=Pseudanabaena sp. lw0831 TaxID=1357935 RepID=UPI001916144B|nr:transcriptional regulator, TetR family [Pseudanabaena sp. lw0831]